jgi:YVTN family beta-propeller protein
MKQIRLNPCSLGLLASLFCGGATVLFGCFWFLSAAGQDIKIANQPASEGRPITPAGTLLLDAATRLPAVAPLTVDFVRTPDNDGPDGKGRYLIAVNSGFGLQFNAATNGGQQSLAVIDLNAKPAPVVIQNVYFPTPQSASVGVAIAARAEQDGGHLMYVSGGVENKIWMFRFTPGARAPISPASPGPNTRVEAPFIDVNGFAAQAPTPRYNGNFAPVYPAGVALSPDGETLRHPTSMILNAAKTRLYVVNSNADSVSVIDTATDKELERVNVRLAEKALPGGSPESLALSADEKTLFVANAHSNAVAVGKLVEAVSRSPYWRDTAIFIIEDDSQDGPDHVDMHRSPAFVISAYNRPGALIHEFHNTVSLIRTMEILLGLPPMNQLDAAAAPIDIFRDEADLRPYQAIMPDVALDNLIAAPARDARTAYWMKRTQEQNLARPDQADPNTLNRVIWFSVRGDSYPEHRIAHLPAFDLMLVGLLRENDEDEKEERLERRRDARLRRVMTARRQPAK